MTAKWLIYALADPRDGVVFYVGRSSTGYSRPRSHSGAAAFRDHGHLPVTRECGRLLAVNLEPAIIVLQEHHDGPDRLNEAEQFFIKQFREAGHARCNVTDGGDGTVGWVPTEETRARIGAAHVGMKASAATLARMSVAARNRSPEVNARAAAKRMGQKASPETRAKISAAMKIRTFSAEHRARISAALSGRTLTPEHRANMGAARTGKIQSPESLAKRSAAMMGRTFTAEAIEKMRIAQRARRASTVVSAETRAKMSEANRNRSPEAHANMCAAQQARHARARLANAA